MSWTVYEPTIDVHARKAGMPLPRAIETLTDFIGRGVEDGSISLNEMLGLLAERSWNTLGRPSYRVALPLVEALVKTDLDLDASLIRLPHPAFALELPGDFVLRNRSGHRLLGLLVSATREETRESGRRAIGVDAPDGEGTWRFLVIQSWEGEEGAPIIFTLSLKPGDRIGARISEIETEAGYRQGHDPTITDESDLRRIVALALGSAFFAVGANVKLIKPLGRGPKQQKRKGRRADRRPPEPRRWSLGADIALPRHHAQASAGDDAPAPGDEDEPGRSLRWAHIRQGHLRLTPTGPRADRRYVLRYIAPTVVRPDLPLAPRATRHTMDVPTKEPSGGPPGPS